MFKDMSIFCNMTKRDKEAIFIRKQTNQQQAMTCF